MTITTEQLIAHCKTTGDLATLRRYRQILKINRDLQVRIVGKRLVQALDERDAALGLDSVPDDDHLLRLLD